MWTQTVSEQPATDPTGDSEVGEARPQILMTSPYTLIVISAVYPANRLGPATITSNLLTMFRDRPLPSNEVEPEVREPKPKRAPQQFLPYPLYASVPIVPLQLLSSDWPHRAAANAR